MARSRSGDLETVLRTDTVGLGNNAMNVGFAQLFCVEGLVGTYFIIRKLLLINHESSIIPS
jgi:hypothetical protein